MIKKICKNQTLIFFIVVALIFIFNANFLYAKSLELNGIKVSLTTDVVKRKVGKGVSVKEENNFSSKEENVSETSENSKYTNDFNEEDKTRDEYVKISLSVRNNNPYESANITIKENVNSGFKQIASNKLDKKISFKIDSKKEKTYKYNYKYTKHTILDQIKKIIYGDKESVEIENNDVNIETDDGSKIEIEDKDFKYQEQTTEKVTGEDKENKKDNTFKTVLILFIIIIVGISIFIMFLTFIQTIRDKDVDFNDKNNFNSFILFLVMSLLISITFNKNVFATDYTPVIYQKGESFTKTIKESVLFNDRYFEFSYEITVKYENKNEITDYETDTDGDGLVDALEYLYMTDINDKDTDGDGLSDYLEVMIMNYNPNSKWTFNDGKNDGYRDYDGDGLRNKKEIEIGTDPTLYDTDYDNLDDYEEVNGVLSKDGTKRYETDPLKADTDDDGLRDDIEIKLGLDPTNPMTDGVTPDAERKIEQTFSLSNISKNLTNSTFPIISVSGCVKGDIDKELRIKEYSNENLKNSNLLIGKCISVELNDSTSNDTVNITVDCSNYGERVEKLTFVKYENGIMEYVETDVEGNNITAKLGNGNYAIVDAEQYLRKMHIYIGDY